ARTPHASLALGASLPLWVLVFASGAAFGIASVSAAPYALRMLSISKSSEATVAVERRAEPPAIVRKPTGTVSVTSSPAGARVVVDGRPRGVTPLQLSDVSPGRHDVVLTSDAAEVRRTITVAAGKTATLDEAIFPGW